MGCCNGSPQSRRELQHRVCSIEDSDESLLQCLSSHCAEQALKILIDRHSARMFRIVVRMGGINTESAEDIVQEAFIKLWLAPKKFSHAKKSRFLSWFTRIVINQAIDTQRKQNRREILDNDADIAVSFLDNSENQARKKLFQTAFQQLPERQQQALNLCFFEEFSNQEAADIMDITCKALQSLVMRGKTHMRQYVSKFLQAQDAQQAEREKNHARKKITQNT